MADSFRSHSNIYFFMTLCWVPLNNFNVNYNTVSSIKYLYLLLHLLSKVDTYRFVLLNLVTIVLRDNLLSIYLIFWSKNTRPLDCFFINPVVFFCLSYRRTSRSFFVFPINLGVSCFCLSN